MDVLYLAVYLNRFFLLDNEYFESQFARLFAEKELLFYFLKEKFDKLGLQDYKEFIHFALTSQNINNTATPYSLNQAWLEVVQTVFN